MKYFLQAFIIIILRVMFIIVPAIFFMTTLRSILSRYIPVVGKESLAIGVVAILLTGLSFLIFFQLKSILNKPKEKLHRAAYRDDVLEMRKLIQNGFDINAKDSKGWTPLHYAIFNTSFDAAKFLLKNNAEINFQDKKGLSPLSLAIKVNSLHLVELLLEHGANLQLRHKNRQTIAEFASGIYYINPFSSCEVLQDIRKAIKKAAEKPPKS